jgi:hypothetical protein
MRFRKRFNLQLVSTGSLKLANPLVHWARKDSIEAGCHQHDAVSKDSNCAIAENDCDGGSDAEWLQSSSSRYHLMARNYGNTPPTWTGPSASHINAPSRILIKQSTTPGTSTQNTHDLFTLMPYQVQCMSYNPLRRSRNRRIFVVIRLHLTYSGSLSSTITGQHLDPVNNPYQPRGGL